MQKNLVIVESPAKAKTIERFLGDDYKVMSSYGHIRDLKKKGISLDEKTLMPAYEIPDDKKKVVSELRANAKKAEQVWLASDEDREGEAISWHLCEVLKLDKDKTKRIVFHEITKNAILQAIETPRTLDMNLVNAQQARRVLDRLVGFKLSPVLWRKVKPALSAGRVQSVAVRLIVEREREVEAFNSEPYFRVTALFTLNNDKKTVVKANLDRRFSTKEEAEAFLELCKNADFTVTDVQKKPTKRTPAPPFTTSTLQQEAARKLGFTVSQTMLIAQHLYEHGEITYMRTDSVNLSGLCINASKKEITEQYGEEYSKVRQYHTSSKGAQEAHEAIRPTYMDKTEIEGNSAEKRLYELIRKRTIASQMADAELEKTTATISISGTDACFVANGEVIVFDGFLKVYRESTDDDDNNKQESESNMLPQMIAGDTLSRKEIVSTQCFSQGPIRFTEASLVHKLEELGIGRPSTYAPTISTIQQREYVHKGDKPGYEREYAVITLKNDKISTATKKEKAGSEKGKLMPTDIGTIVNDFLIDQFPNILDYNFTAKVEQDFDSIAEGKADWLKSIQEFDKDFEKDVDAAMDTHSEHKVGERELGIDPKSGKPVYVKIGRYGPVVQLGAAGEEEKPVFAQLPAGRTMSDMTLEDAVKLFELPKDLGKYEGKTISIGTGRFGPYVLHNKKYTSIPKGTDPMSLTLEDAIALIEEKQKAEEKKVVKTFTEDAKLEIRTGRYGIYIAYDGKNFRMPKAMQQKAEALTYDECMEIVKK
ncbi:MAG: type I DNA topoisomerase [Bacteroidaceae bacterium]|nr:type I DNA topoisomerase [Bacteroidaceae bacterium]